MKNWQDKYFPRDNPSTNPTVAKSKCCNADCGRAPASFGETSWVYCTNCNTQCEYEFKPIFEKISQGTYRKIIYSIKPKLINP